MLMWMHYKLCLRLNLCSCTCKTGINRFSQQTRELLTVMNASGSKLQRCMKASTATWFWLGRTSRTSPTSYSIVWKFKGRKKGGFYKVVSSRIQIWKWSIGAMVKVSGWKAQVLKFKSLEWPLNTKMLNGRGWTVSKPPFPEPHLKWDQH